MDNLIDRHKSEKLYVQLFDILKKKIEDGDWPVTSQIPTEEEICRTYEVSKATVRLSVLELVRQGYLTRQQGKGTFVCKRIIPEGLMMSTSFRELMLEAGVNFSTKLLAKTVTMPIDDIDVKLGVPEDRHIIYIRRLRLLDNEPILLQESYIPHHLCPSLLHDDVEDNSLFDLFEKKYGMKITRIVDFIEIAHVTAAEGQVLGLPEGAVAMLLEQHFYAGDTQVMYMRSVKRPERFRFYIEMERK
ncbi:MAG: GntR family transcriptional regulator [Nitrospirae bacterium]|nr:GntR family transcriptional regulator [Nitrospirota bacterium]